MAEMHVELVTPDTKVWTGEATSVVVRTSDGDLGILPNHEPVLAILANGPVTIESADGERLRAAVLGGFLSVSNNAVSILAENAILAEDISESEVRSALSEAESAGDGEAVSHLRAQLAALHGHH